MKQDCLTNKSRDDFITPSAQNLAAWESVSEQHTEPAKPKNLVLSTAGKVQSLPIMESRALILEGVFIAKCLYPS